MAQERISRHRGAAAWLLMASLLMSTRGNAARPERQLQDSWEELSLSALLAAGAGRRPFPAEKANLGISLVTSHPSQGAGPLPAVVGSKLARPAEVEAFRSKWSCLASDRLYHWALNTTPRLLPWTNRNNRYTGTRGSAIFGPPHNKAFLEGQFTESNWPVAENLKYVWGLRNPQGPQCAPQAPPSLLAMDGVGFCSALRRKGGSLFIIGDSISALFLNALRGELEGGGMPVIELPPTPACEEYRAEMSRRGKKGPLRGTVPPCLRWRVCGPSEEEGGVELHYAVSLYLGGLHAPGEDKRRDELFSARHLNRSSAREGETDPETVWGREMVEHKASVVLLNRGIHYIDTDDFAPQIEYTLTELRKMLPQSLIFFRSTFPGHPHCQNFDKPIETPMELDRWPYHWKDAEAQNPIARDAVERAGGVFVDINPMTALRPDWHSRPGRDCLHYQLPGPPNGWVKLWASMLQDLV